MNKSGDSAVDPATAPESRSLGIAVRHLLAQQREEGFWWSDLTADSTLESDWFLLQLWLHPPRDGRWNHPDSNRVERAADSILRRQNADGGFGIFPQGPSEINASVKAYFALKLAGLPPEDGRTASLRECILRLGGLQAANSYTKINLSLFNLYPRNAVPTAPPEILLLPGKFLYEMSSWSRAILVPLSIVQSLNRGGRPVPTGFNLDELLAPGVPVQLTVNDDSAWGSLFRLADGFLKKWERIGPGAVRRRAIEAAKNWMLERMGPESDGLAAIYPSMLYSIMALDLLGYGQNSPERVRAEKEFNRLIVERDGEFFIMPCFSPVWDTAIAAFAVGESGQAPSVALARAGDWLVKKEVRRKGDWSVKRPDTQPSGWYFEFANEFYPDIDDTAMVLLALSHCRDAAEGAARANIEAAARRGVQWLISMQSRDGGWAAFDADSDWTALGSMPFADHNAMLDPTCPDITGRVLEALTRWGEDPRSAPVRRGVEFLLEHQEPDGSWYGRWGVNYVYGTAHALRGLRAAGYDDREASVLRAGEWLRSIQNADGGWGECCSGYDQRTFVPAPSTPSQTAWAVSGLLAGGDTTSESVRRGAEFLMSKQLPGGGWEEHLATGTGFPGVFYLSYHIYRDAFPLLALAEYRRSRDGVEA